MICAFSDYPIKMQLVVFNLEIIAMSMRIIMIGSFNNGDFDLKLPIAKLKRYTVLAIRVIVMGMTSH